MSCNIVLCPYSSEKRGLCLNHLEQWFLSGEYSRERAMDQVAADATVDAAELSGYTQAMNDFVRRVYRAEIEARGSLVTAA